MGTAIVQGQLWGERARDWAEVQEGMFACLFQAVLQKIDVGEGMSLLDIGCGSGAFCEMAAKRGARVSGLDAAEPLLAIARERVPEGDFRRGEMEELPFAKGTFDVVTGFNSFQYAASPVNALKEARRAARRGGSLIIGVWGKPEDSDAKAYFAAIGSLLPPPPPGTPGPFALSMDGALEALVAQAGMNPGEVHDVDCLWEYPDDQTLLRGLLSAGPGVRAIQHAGEAAVRQAVLKSLAPHKIATGEYKFSNKARYMIVKT
jgi:SAM-dependent methyltransferase